MARKRQRPSPLIGCTRNTCGRQRQRHEHCELVSVVSVAYQAKVCRFAGCARVRLWRCHGCASVALQALTPLRTKGRHQTLHASRVSPPACHTSVALGLTRACRPDDKAWLRHNHSTRLAQLATTCGTTCGVPQAAPELGVGRARAWLREAEGGKQIGSMVGQR